MPRFSSITIESGAEQFGGPGTYHKTFPPNSFNNEPTVIVSVAGFYLTSILSSNDFSLFVAAQNITSAGFDIAIAQNVDAPVINNVRITWVAIG